MLQNLSNITIGQIIQFLTLILGGISVLIEFNKKIPYKPLTAFFKWIGNGLNKDLQKKLDRIEKQQKEYKEAIEALDKEMAKKFEEKQKSDDEKEAKRLRANIVCFADACRIGQKHTQHHFENVMRDYSDYMEYCEKHDIANHYIENDYIYIQEVYKKCLKENSFL